MSRKQPGHSGLTPMSVTRMRAGYGRSALIADATAGLTVAIVALPLSMAIAIASGLTPDRGLFTAIIGGFIVSLLGGSRYQIGGPAGAFIVLISVITAAHGVDGLILATIMAGVILLALGALRLGSYVQFIPFPVVVGFTTGIAVIIFASQITALLGLTLAGAEPGPLFAKLGAIGAALPTATPAAMFTSAITIGMILFIRRFRPRWPALLIAVGVASAIATLAHLPVETISSRFGAMPRTPPLPSLPDISYARLIELLPSAVSLALLGAIESLLSAVVADSMSDERHRPNAELLGQGVANIASALFGGMTVTGTIARTATNVRAGAHGPVAGMMHAGFLLLFLLIAAPLAGYIPLAALAGLLALVAWNMAEWREVGLLLRGSRGEAVVLAATFLLTIFVGLAEGIVVGFGLKAMIFIHRMSEAAEIEQLPGAPSEPPETPETHDPDIVVYRLKGVYFFGAAATAGHALDAISTGCRALVIDFHDVRVVDTSGARMLAAFLTRMQRSDLDLIAASVSPDVRRAMRKHGHGTHHIRYAPTLEDAIEMAQAKNDGDETDAQKADV